MKLDLNKLVNNTVNTDNDRRSNTSPITVSSKPVIPTDELINRSLKFSKDAQSYSKEEWDEYAKYDVFLNKNKTREELDRERAENQSGLEQLGRMVGQGVGNEIVLGTIGGLFNLTDAIKNAYSGLTGDYTADYQGNASKAIDDAQEFLREKWAIYQKDPNKHFAFNDFGWWTQNAISTLSSISLLIPSGGIVKGASYLGKLGKGMRVADKTLKGFDKLKSANRYAKAITPTIGSARKELAATSILSRTMENQMEAKEVYKNVYEQSLDKLNSMSDIERTQFFKTNPEFDGQSNEDIAKTIAYQGAEKTFLNDYAMLMFDVAQIKALGNIWKGVANKGTTATIRNAQRKAISSMAPEVTETTEQVVKKGLDLDTRLGRTIDSIKYAFKHPKDSPVFAQLSEGIEEGYQGIQTQKGEETFDIIFNNATPKGLGSYLTDPEIWEQAIWGVLGGITFQALGTGVGKLSNKIKAKINKDNMTQEEFDLALTSEEDIRIKEINTRAALINNYNEKMEQINNGINPNAKKGEDNSFASVEEQERAKRELTEELISEMTISAIDAGNYDLLEEYVKNENFDKQFRESGIDTSMGKEFLSHMQEVKNIYIRALRDIQDNVNIRYASVAQLAARNITRRELNIETNNDFIDLLERRFNADPDAQNVTEENKDYFKILVANELIKNIDKKISDTNALSQLGASGAYPISKSAAEAIIKEFNNQKEYIYKWLLNNTTNGRFEQLKEYINSLDNTNPITENQWREIKSKYDEAISNIGNIAPSNIKNSLVEDYTNFIFNSINNGYEEYAIPFTKNEFKNLYEELETQVEGTVIEKFDRAAKRVIDYLQSQDNLDEAYDNILKENVDDSLKEDLKTLKLGYHSTYKYLDNILLAVGKIQQERTETATRPERIINNEQEATNAERKVVDETINANTSTGGVNQSETADTANTAGLDSSKPPVEGTSQSQTDSNLYVIEVVNPDGSISYEYVEKGEEDIKLTPSEEESLKVIAEQLGDPTILDSNNIYIDEIGNHFNSLLRNQDTKEQTKQAIIKGLGSKEYTDLINDIVEYVIERTGVSRAVALEHVRLAVKLRQEQLLSFNLVKDSNLKASIVKNIQELANKTRFIQAIDGNFSTIEDIGDEAWIEQATKFIEELYDNSLINVNGEYLIDINDLFNKLIKSAEDNSVSIDNVRAIYGYIKRLIKGNKLGKKIKVINSELLKDGENDFFSKLNNLASTIENIDDNYHVIVSESVRKNTDILNRALGNKVSIKYTSDKKTSADIIFEGTKIGYIPFVKKSSDNNTLSLMSDNDRPLSNNETNGKFRYKVYISGSGVRLNIDDIFLPILNQTEADGAKEAFEILYKFYINDINRFGIDYVTNEEFERFLNLPIIKKFLDIKNGYYKEAPVGNKTTANRARTIMSDITRTLFFSNNKSVLTDINSIKISYNIYKFNVKRNYENTIRIQEELANSTDTKGIEIILNNISDRKLIITKDERDINSIGLNPNKHTIIAVNKQGEIETEQGSFNLRNTPMLTRGTMGFLIDDVNGNPMIARFTSANTVDNGNPKLFSAIEQHIRLVLNNYYNAQTVDEINKAFDDLVTLFTQLSAYNTTNIFAGYGVYYDDDRKILVLNYGNDLKRQAITFYKYSNALEWDSARKQYKRKIKEPGLNDYIDLNNEQDVLPFLSKATYIKSKGTGKQTRYYGEFNKAIDAIINELKEGLKFNRTFFSINNKNAEDVNASAFFRKEKGKLVIEIGSFKESYDNFGDLVIKNNAFKTNQGTNSNGGYYEVSPIVNSLFLNVNSVSSAKDEGLEIVSRIVNNANGILLKDILYSYNISQDAIDILVNKTGFLPKKIFYDDKIDTLGFNSYYNNSDKKVYITKAGADAIRTNPNILVRLLIHESVHKQVANTKFFSGKIGEERVKQLLETYRQFSEAIKKDTRTDARTLALKEFDKQFTKEHFKSLAKRTPIDTFFMNEWMAEVISRQSLREYLNEITYDDSTIAKVDGSTRKESILSRILDFIMKLFDKVGNIEKNTILEQIYNISKNTDENIKDNTEIKEDTGTKTTSEEIDNNTKDEIPPTTESEPVITEETEFTVTNEEIENYNIDDYDIDSFDDDTSMFSSIDDFTELYDKDSTNNPTGIMNATNMDKFIGQFNVNNRAEIATELTHNRLKYYCR